MMRVDTVELAGVIAAGLVPAPHPHLALGVARAAGPAFLHKQTPPSSGPPRCLDTATPAASVGSSPATKHLRSRGVVVFRSLDDCVAGACVVACPIRSQVCLIHAQLRQVRQRAAQLRLARRSPLHPGRQRDASLPGHCCVSDSLRSSIVHYLRSWCEDANQHGEPALVEAAVGKLIVLQKAVVARVDAVGV